MIKIEKKLLESKLKKKVIKDAICLGLDTASKTGWALAEVKDKYVEIDYSFISIKSKDQLEKFNYLIEFFDNFIKTRLMNKKNPLIIIEDVFYSRNVNVVKILCRIGMIVYVLSFLTKINRKFLLAISARSFLGLKTNVKKQVVQAQIKELLNINIDDEDIVDAIILSLCGVLEETKLDI